MIKAIVATGGGAVVMPGSIDFAAVRLRSCVPGRLIGSQNSRTPAANRIHEPDLRGSAQSIDCDGPFDDFTASNELCPKRSCEETAFDGWCDLAAIDVRHDVGDRRFSDLALPVPENHVVEPWRPRLLVTGTVRRLVKEEDI